MKKKINSILSIAVTAALAFSSFPAAIVNADSTVVDVAPSIAIYPPMDSGSSSDMSDVAMKTALTKVKQRVSIPSELSEFRYHSYSYNNTTTYSFSWTTPSGASFYKSLDVSIVGNIITNYNYNDGTNTYSNEPKFAKLSDAELLKKAKEYLQKFNPTIASQCTVTSNGVSLSGTTASFSFNRKYNDIKVQQNYGTIYLDKNTGKLSSMYTNWWDNASFKSSANVISTSTLQAAYKSLNKLTPYYTIETNSETGEKTAKIVYVPSYANDIDAFTGKESSMYADMDNGNDKIYPTASPAIFGEVVEEEAMEDSSVTFTEAEKKAISANENMLTKEQVIDIFKKDKYLKFTSDYKLTNSTLYDDPNYDSRFYWTMNFNIDNNAEYKYLSIKVDAETGKILYFDKYSYYRTDNKNNSLPELNVTKAKAIANDALKHYLPDIAANYKASEDNERAITYWGDNNEYYDTSRTFSYNRFVNNIQVSDDYAYINVNSNNEVMSFNYKYTEDVKFQKADILSVNNAYSKIFAQVTPELSYNGFIDKNGKTKTYLVYNYGGYTINAKTGKLCDYYGNDVVSSGDTTISYSDIKGISAEKAINEFKRHGVTLESINGKFEPNKAITEQEFSHLVDNIFNTWVAYPMYFKENSNDTNNSKLVSDKNLTKAAACKYLVQVWNADDYAKLKGIFKTPFTDVPETRSDIGYIAIAYAKGFIPASYGKLNPDKTMTRAEAIQMLYDYIVKANS